jgi:hypothetical protein
MQIRLGRDLRDVRVHTSTQAQSLRAEAFTSGRNIVFAPGRFDLRTKGGLALLGHELTHIGQPLAFKQESGAEQVPEDSHELAAHQQEEQIQNIVESGWPKTHPMELQHSVQTTASPVPPMKTLSIQRMTTDSVETLQREEAGGTQPGATTPMNGNSNQAGALPQTASQPGHLSAATPQPANVDALARQVYSILKSRLRAEHERHSLYGL